MDRREKRELKSMIEANESKAVQIFKEASKVFLSIDLKK
jgi:hypothetical protein